MEDDKPVKRVYVKKTKVVEPISEIIESIEPEPKPKRTYTKKKKEEEITTTIPIEEEKKPKRVYIKKNKTLVQEHNNIESINIQIDGIQKDLDNLKISEEVEIQEKPIISNNISLVENENIGDLKEYKRKFDDNLVHEAKKTSLYTCDIDIDINLNLYIYDKFFDGSKKNKKSVLQISSFISIPIVDLEQYITKHFYIKSNNFDIRVCYLGNNFNKELIKRMNEYNIETKLYIDNNTHKNVYEELISSYNKNKIDFMYFKKYIVEVLFYEVYSEIYS
jgi:hypothetical protein